MCAALQLEPGNAGTKQALEDTIASRASARNGGGGGGAGLFGPEVMSRLATDPRTRSYLTDPEFLNMLQEVQQNPMASMTKFLGNEKFQQAINVCTPPSCTQPALDITSTNAKICSSGTRKIKPAKWFNSFPGNRASHD